MQTRLINQARSPERRYIIGAEIALAVLIASGGIASTKIGKAVPADTSGGTHPEREAQYEDQHSLHLKAQLEISNRLNRQLLTRPQLISPLTMLCRRLEDAPVGWQMIASGTIENIHNPIDRLPAQHLGVDPTDADWTPPGRPQASFSQRRTILVQESDTLLSIAEHYFDDPNLGWLIADLNRPNLKESFVDGKRIVELRTRQQLFLPDSEDIEQFYRQARTARTDSLVTIVEQSQLDRELLSTILGRVITEKRIQIENKNSPSIDPRTQPDEGAETPNSSGDA